MAEEAWTGTAAEADSTSTGACVATAAGRKCSCAGHAGKVKVQKQVSLTAVCGMTWGGREASASVLRPSSRWCLRTCIRRSNWRCCRNLGCCSRRAGYQWCLSLVRWESSSFRVFGLTSTPIDDAPTEVDEPGVDAAGEQHSTVESDATEAADDPVADVESDAA